LILNFFVSNASFYEKYKHDRNILFITINFHHTCKVALIIQRIRMNLIFSLIYFNFGVIMRKNLKCFDEYHFAFS